MKQSLLLFWLLTATISWAQGVIRVDGNTLYSEIEERVKPGTTILLGQNAALILRGDINISGTDSKRIVIKSNDPVKPGRGLIVGASSEEGASFKLEHVIFKHLQEAIFFESYNHYANISLSHSQFIYCGYNGATLSMYNMLPGGNTSATKISLDHLRFLGNSGPVRIFSLDDEVSMMSITNSLFAYNLRYDSEGELLQIESFSRDQEKNINLSNNVFFRNKEVGSDLPWSIELKGIRDTLSEASLYMSEAELKYVYDGRRDYNRSYLPIKRIPSLPSFAIGFDQIPSFEWKGDTLLSASASNLELVRDQQGQMVQWTKKGSEKVLLSGIIPGAKYALGLLDGRTVIVQAEVEETILDETLDGNEGVDPLTDEAKAVADSLARLLSDDQIQVIVDPIWSYPKQELGFMTGVSYYIGDANRGGIFPSALDFGLTAFYGFLLNDRWSFGGRYQFTRIATGAGSLLSFSPPKNDHVFRNDLHSIRAESFYSLWRRKQGKSIYGYLTGEIGLGLGAVFYDPKYRVYDPVEKRRRWYRFRPYGTEGQNFLPGEDQYGYIALEVVGMARLRWTMGKMSLFVEGALNVTSTDYLDDMSDGYYYGGNIDDYLDNPPASTSLSDMGGEGRRAIARAAENGRPNAKITRGYNALPDSYVTFQVGFSYAFDWLQ